MPVHNDFNPQNNPGKLQYVDIAIILAISIIIYFFSSAYDILEWIVEFSWQHERLEIDEFLTVTFCASFALLFILARRWKTLKQTNELLRQRSVTLQEALSEIKQLRGILPICASCKKIRDDAGYWHQVESYISRHADVSFTHGICPECLEKLYPDFVREKNAAKDS